MARRHVALMVLAAIAHILLCPLAAEEVYARGPVTYIEPFTHNVNGWWAGDNPDAKAEVAKGRYVLQRKVDRAWQVTSRIPVQFDANADFRIDTEVRFSEGSETWGYGLIYGVDWTHGAWSYDDFTINAGGGFLIARCDKGKYTGPWANSPLINKNQAVNRLSVERSGDGVTFFINGQQAGRRQFAPLFGNSLGFNIPPRGRIEVTKLAITFNSTRVPPGWSVVSEGSFNNSMQYGKEGTGFRGEVFNHGTIRASRKVGGSGAVVSARIKSPSCDVAKDKARANLQGESTGLFLQTAEGALLKLETICRLQERVVRFIPAAHGKEMGLKEVAIAPESNPVLTIKRQGDLFAGEVAIDDKAVEVGSLTWPKLSPGQDVGTFMTYSNDSDTAAPSFACEFIDFQGGTR